MTMTRPDRSLKSNLHGLNFPLTQNSLSIVLAICIDGEQSPTLGAAVGGRPNEA